MGINRAVRRKERRDACQELHLLKREMESDIDGMSMDVGERRPHPSTHSTKKALRTIARATTALTETVADIQSAAVRQEFALELLIDTVNVRLQDLYGIVADTNGRIDLMNDEMMRMRDLTRDRLSVLLSLVYRLGRNLDADIVVSRRTTILDGDARCGCGVVLASRETHACEYSDAGRIANRSAIMKSISSTTS